VAICPEAVFSHGGSVANDSSAACDQATADRTPGSYRVERPADLLPRRRAAAPVHSWVSCVGRAVTKPTPHGTNNGYAHYGCRCAECRAAHAAYYRTHQRIRYRRKKGLPDDYAFPARTKELIHGTHDGYVNRGCRCDECKAAAAGYRAGRFKNGICAAPGCDATIWTSMKGRTGLCRRCSSLARRTAEHGSMAMYQRGCRCDACRAASNAARRSYRARNLEAQRAYDREYKRRRAKASA
jgi:hypothetical protein